MTEPLPATVELPVMAQPGLQGRILAQASVASTPAPREQARTSSDPKPGIPAPPPGKMVAPRGPAVEMGPSIIPLIFGVIIVGLWFGTQGERQTDVRKRLSRDRDYYLSLALVPVGLVILSYLFAPSVWLVRAAWVGLVVVVAMALRGLLGQDREELQRGIELPEDIRNRLD